MMNAGAQPTNDDELISAYVDGRLSQTERANVEARLSRDTDFAQRVQVTRLLVETAAKMPAVRLPRSFTLPPNAPANLSIWSRIFNRPPPSQTALRVGSLVATVLFVGFGALTLMSPPNATVPAAAPAAAPAAIASKPTAAVAAASPVAPAQARGVAPSESPAAGQSTPAQAKQNVESGVVGAASADAGGNAISAAAANPAPMAASAAQVAAPTSTPKPAPTVAPTPLPTSLPATAAPSPQAPAQHAEQPAQPQTVSWTLIAAALSAIAAIVLAILGWRRIA